MTHPEHPLIALYHPHAAADLVRERLKTKPLVGNGQRTADAIRRALGSLHGEKVIQGFFEPAIEKKMETAERDETFAGPDRPVQLSGKVEAVDRVQEEQGANTLVEVVTPAPEVVELDAV